MKRNLISGFALVLILMGCDHREVITHEDDPGELSQWGLFKLTEKELTVNQKVIPYELNTPLFTDYAFKLRTIWLPDGQSMRYKINEAFEFPVGSIISKTFYYPKNKDGLVKSSLRSPFNRKLNLEQVHLIETRLLVLRQNGWTALPYVWNEEQTEAFLQIAGDIRHLAFNGEAEQGFNYIIPNTNECQTCHTTDHARHTIIPIGIKARHIHRSTTSQSGHASQLGRWVQNGLLTGMPNEATVKGLVDWQDEEASLEDRARAYLDINCAHCHQEGGSADSSHLFLASDITNGRQLGVCKPPIAAGQGTGGRKYSIEPGSPDKSIILFRMQTNDPGAMMPELGRSLVHTEGVQLISQWIATWTGSCEQHSETMLDSR